MTENINRTWLNKFHTYEPYLNMWNQKCNKIKDNKACIYFEKVLKTVLFWKVITKEALIAKININ